MNFLKRFFKQKAYVWDIIVAFLEIYSPLEFVLTLKGWFFLKIDRQSGQNGNGVIPSVETGACPAVCNNQ